MCQVQETLNLYISQSTKRQGTGLTQRLPCAITISEFIRGLALLPSLSVLPSLPHWAPHQSFQSPELCTGSLAVELQRESFIKHQTAPFKCFPVVGHSTQLNQPSSGFSGQGWGRGSCCGILDSLAQNIGFSGDTQLQKKWFIKKQYTSKNWKVVQSREKSQRPSELIYKGLGLLQAV